MKKQPTKRQIQIAEHWIKKTTKRLVEEDIKEQIYFGVYRVRGNSYELISAYLKLIDANKLKTILEHGTPPAKHETYLIKKVKYSQFGWEGI